MKNTILNINQKTLVSMSLGFFCLLSLATNISFWISIPSGTLSKTMFGLFAALFELTKFVALGKVFGSGKLKSAISCIMAAVLSLASALGTIGLLNSFVQTEKVLAVERSKEYQSLSESILAKKMLIEDLSLAAKKDIDSGYRTRGLKTFDKVAKEQDALKELSLHLAAIGDKQGSIISGASSIISSPLSLSSGAFEKGVIFFMGALLELSGLFLFLVGFGHNKETKMADKKILLKEPLASYVKEEKKSPPVKSGKLFLCNPKTNSLSHVTDIRYSRVKASIISGSIRPVIREIKEFANIGTKKAHKMLLDLTNEGVLQQGSNKRYVLA